MLGLVLGALKGTDELCQSMFASKKSKAILLGVTFLACAKAGFFSSFLQ